jgi:hypothetical protein
MVDMPSLYRKATCRVTIRNSFIAVQWCAYHGMRRRAAYEQQLGISIGPLKFNRHFNGALKIQ